MDLNLKLKNIIAESKVLDEKDNLRPENFKDFLKRLNEQYNQQEEQIEKLQIILDTNPCTISWVTKNIEYVGVNKTLADICNLPKDDFPNKKVGYYTEDKYFYNFTQQLFESEDSTHYEELKANLNDEEKRFWVVGTKFDKGNQAIIIGMDITELKSMENTINLMEKLSSLGEMVASIIHEVNNPLAMINLQAMQIRRFVEKEQFDKISDMALKIDETTERISKLIVGIKTFVRRGDNDPKKSANLNNIISDAKTICEGRIKETSVTFKYEPKQDEVNINCNVTHIFQVFVNLITNSLDAIHDLEEKWIEIKVEEDNEHIKVYFIDSGKGISPNISKKIFENFYTTKDIGKGTGIGLALSKKIMESHDGSIYYKNGSEHTTFVLEFKK